MNERETTLNAGERLDVIASELMGEAFCADWHDDPDVGVRETDRIKKLFVGRINEFVCDEIRRALPAHGPAQIPAGEVEHSCPCGKGSEPCPGPDGVPLCVYAPDDSGQARSGVLTPDDPSRDDLIESIRHAAGMISAFIEEYHDFDYEPHQVPAELEAIRRVQYHLEGSLINSKGETAALVVPEAAEGRGAEILKHADELHDVGFEGGWNAALEMAASVAANNGWEATAAQIRALAVASANCSCGGLLGQPAGHHDISCPLALSAERGRG